MGQIKAKLARLSPGVQVIDLITDLPTFQPKSAAYLIAAYTEVLDVDDVSLAVVDQASEVLENRR